MFACYTGPDPDSVVFVGVDYIKLVCVVIDNLYQVLSLHHIKASVHSYVIGQMFGAIKIVNSLMIGLLKLDYEFPSSYP